MVASQTAGCSCIVNVCVCGHVYVHVCVHTCVLVSSHRLVASRLCLQGRHRHVYSAPVCTPVSFLPSYWSHTLPANNVSPWQHRLTRLVNYKHLHTQTLNSKFILRSAIFFTKDELHSTAVDMLMQTPFQLLLKHSAMPHMLPKSFYNSITIIPSLSTAWYPFTHLNELGQSWMDKTG